MDRKIIDNCIESRGIQVSALNAAKATDYFEHFLNANTLKTILGYYRNICELLHLKPNVYPQFYPKLRASLQSWRAKALWKKFDARSNNKCYGKGKLCPNTRVLIIGGGPCGLRTAIESQLLGAKVVVVEKRDRMSRNNVLHLWPFVIDDLRSLGAKKFFGKFCAGAIDHISIRQLQCILLKVALLLGVEVHTEVSFEALIEPNIQEKTGWRADFLPSEHPVNQFEFDVIIGADGKRNTLQGFKRKEFRGKLAIAITANFINKRTEAEARVEEISGVAFIFNQKFFKDLYADTGIDLENIVYYKDDTHYFVMTAKKPSLIDKGVIMRDLPDTARLLSPENVDREALMNYAREAAEFSTNYKMLDLEFAVNHYGQPDVAMFDFTSMYAAENASRIIERNGYKLFTILVGDSLLEPFWPTGSGCARGFLSALDAAWAIRGYGSGMLSPLEVLAERESIYRLLAQTTPENLNKDYKGYTVDPSTRYPNLNRNVLLPQQTLSLFDSDEPKNVANKQPSDAAAGVVDIPKKRRRRDSHVDPATLLSWLKDQIKEHEDLKVNDLTTSFKDGRLLCAIIQHYRPDLMDYSAITAETSANANQLAFDLLENEIGIPPIMTGEEMANKDVPDYHTMVSYLTIIYDTFRCEIPHIKHPKLKEKMHPQIRKPPPTSLQNPYNVKINRSETCNKQHLQKSKFSLVNRISNIETDLNVNELNLTPIKSIQEYKIINCAENICSDSCSCRSKNNSKSCIVKCSLSDFQKKRRFFNRNAPNNVQKYINPKREVLKRKNIRKKNSKEYVITQKMFSKQSKILQAKIDSVFNKRTKSEPGKVKVLNVAQKLQKSDTFINTNNLLKLKLKDTIDCSTNTTHKILSIFTNINANVQESDWKLPKIPKLVENNTNSICYCCQINKRNFINNKLDFFNKIEQKYLSLHNNFTVCKCVDCVVKNDTKLVKKAIKANDSPVLKSVNAFWCKLKGKFGYQGGFMAKTSADVSNLYFQKRQKCHVNLNNKFSLVKMSHSDTNLIQPERTFDRVVNWITVSNFDIRNGSDSSPKASSIHIDGLSDITSVTRQIKKPERSDILVERVTDVMKFSSDGHRKMVSRVHKTKDRDKEGKSSTAASLESITNFLEDLKNPEIMAQRLSRFSHCPPKRLYDKRIRARSEPPGIFSIIVENEENELPNNKRVETAFTKNHPALLKTSFSVAPVSSTPTPLLQQQQRPSSRHKRHAESANSKTLISALDRKPRKRRTIDKLAVSVEERQKRIEEIVQNRTDRHSKRRQQRKMQTEQFMKSMQMLQANCKPDHSEPFEDYSIFLYRQTAQNFDDRVKDLEKKFTYFPNRENIVPGQSKGEKVDEIQARIKGLEERWKDNLVPDKKPKDLLRAIGKIDKSDWNIKEIEKKIIENKLGKNVNKDKEKVPKWSREQFVARQTKMEKQHLERQDSTGGKYAEIDKNIKQLDLRLKEGSVRDMNTHKIATITEKLKPKEEQLKPIKKSSTKTGAVLPPQGTSEICHFCSKTVYLMERLTAEGRFFHRGCFKCQYCHVILRLGSYLFARDGKFGYRFYCSQHFGMSGEIKVNKNVRKSAHRIKASSRSPEKKIINQVSGLDLLDRVETPERIEFANLSTGHASSDHEESLSQMDEDEWTDKNFGASTAEFGSSDEESSSSSESESDDEDVYEEALEEPPTKEGTLKWAERYNRRYSRKRDDSDSADYSSSDQFSYYENSSGDDESDTATEGEEEIRARELRKQEVRVDPPIAHPDTGTDTEIASDDSSTESSSEIQNSATEISTDSEFAVDDPTPTREVPSIMFNDMFVLKTRGKYVPPKKVQVKTTELQKPKTNPKKHKEIELKFTKITPLVLNPAPITRKPAPTPLLLRTEGYALNRTQSTGGIASKLSLDLKKKYLLGETNLSNSIQKSGSASALDSKFKSFQSNISEHQKLLKSAPIKAEIDTNTYKKAVEIIDLTQIIKAPAKETPIIFEHESEGRPRSPVHETSIIVPQIDWAQKQPIKESSDNVTSESSESALEEIVETINKPINDALLDSLNYESINNKIESQPASINEAPKSITSEKKSLNQPKELPSLLNKPICEDLHNSSGHSTPSNKDGVLTETELSDWAQDDFEDVEYELNSEMKTPAKMNKSKTVENIKKLNEFSEMGHICGKNQYINDLVNNSIITECVNSVLNPNLENIEFMDTGTESSDDCLVEVKNNGYIQLHNEDEMAEDSLSPIINVVEATNPKIFASFDVDFDNLSTVSRNTGYCTIENEKNNFGGQVIDLKAKDLLKLKEKQQFIENEEDSLLIIEPGTTTEENTCSDSTVKNVTAKPIENNNILDKKRLEDKLAQVKEDMKKLNAEKLLKQDYNLEFDQHCVRLQSKVDFGNAKDSIDVRKSRRRSKSGSPPKPDLIIMEEKESSPIHVIELKLAPARYNRESMEKERDNNQKLIQEMVMNKMKAQNKPLERKKRNRNSSFSPNRPFDLSKSATTNQLPNKYCALSTIKPNQINPIQKSMTQSALSEFNKPAEIKSNYTPFVSKNIRPLSVHSSFLTKPPKEIVMEMSNFEAFSLPDIHKASAAPQAAPKAPPRIKNAEKLKQDDEKITKLKTNKRDKENELIGTQHINESIETLVANTDRRNSLFYDNSNKKNHSFKRSKSGEDKISARFINYDEIERTKSFTEIHNGGKNDKDTYFKSDPNLLNTDHVKKPKDRERRKSITKFIADIFGKKKDVSPISTNSGKGFLSRISPKVKNKSKDVVVKETGRRLSLSEKNREFTKVEASPPPVPPLPLNYTGVIPAYDDSSEGESDWKRVERSSCGTLDQSEMHDDSSGRRNSRNARKVARQSQLKRHRLAQEIQRKLEETEVKTRELEKRGVQLEKVLRGEENEPCETEQEDPEILKKWFDLMRDMTELRRYEKELMVRAQEIELEDRHARLQHELKDRLDNDAPKSKEDVETEGSIIKEMMDIVAKRDSLMVLLEEDRIRYSEEDRGIEEELFSKRLTPVFKTSDK